MWLHHTLEPPLLDEHGHVDWGLMWLYRRRKGVAQLRPIFTGDVFKGITPIGETEPATLIILQHPCALMNKDNELREVLLAAKIVDHPDVSVSQWGRNYDRMPVVVLDSKPPLHQAVAFDELALVRTSDLELSRRIACMEIEGIAVLLQRWTNVNTRVVVPRWRFEQVIEPQRAEVEGIEYWCTERGRSGMPMEEAIREATTWLDEKNEDTGKPRRLLLKDQVYAKNLLRRMENVARALADADIVRREETPAPETTPPQESVDPPTVTMDDAAAPAGADAGPEGGQNQDV